MATPVVGANVLSATSAVSGSTLVGTFSAAVPIGSTVSVVIGFSGAVGVTVSSVVDTAGNTYVQRGIKGTGTSTGAYSSIWDCVGTTVALATTDTLTFTLSSAVTYRMLIGFVLTGVASFDSVSAGNTATGTATDAGAMTTAQGNELLVSACSYSSGTATHNPGSGGTEQAEVHATAKGLSYTTFPATTAGSYTPSGTMTVSSLWTSVAVSYIGSATPTKLSPVTARTALMRAATR